MKNLRSIGGVLLMLLFLIACSQPEEGSKKSETTTKGNLNIAIDESVRPALEQIVKVYDSSFPNVNIQAQYLSESEIFDHLFSDSVQLIVATRDISSEEKEVAKQNGFSIRSLSIAKDAIAVIVSKDAQDSIFTVGQLQSILTGDFVREYDIIFDHAQSGTVKYILDSLIPGQTLSSKAYAQENNQGVIDYVSKNKNAIGFLGVNHLYDKEDISGAGRFIDDVRVVSLKNDTLEAFFKPYQAFVAQDHYPLIRRIYFINRDIRQGPSTGFANFLAGERGQIIFNKERFVPLRAQLIIREAQIKQ